MNENLCRALLQAGLTEEDIASGLQVDPKTVRRWLEGRVPYLRHRWALATMVGLNEADLWPHLRSSGSRPDGFQAVYPHLDAVPEDVWLRLFGSAERDIDILTGSAQLIAAYLRVLDVLAAKALSGVRIRICLANPADFAVAQDLGAQAESMSTATEDRGAFSAFRRLRATDHVEIRLLRSVMYSAIYRADDQVLISQQAYSIPPAQVPVLQLCAAGESDMASAYLASFVRAWSSAQPLD